MPAEVLERPVQAKTDKGRYRFKLLSGRHSYNAGTDQNPKLVRFSQGDVIETDVPLDEIYNSPGSIKFQRLEHIVPDTEESLLEEQSKLEARLKALRAKAASEQSDAKQQDAKKKS